MCLLCVKILENEWNIMFLILNDFFFFSMWIVLSIDAMDVSGEQQINLDHNIYKRRLDELGKPLEKPEKERKYIVKLL